MHVLLLLGSAVFLGLMSFAAYWVHQRFGEKIKFLLDIIMLTRISTAVLVLGAFILLLNDQGRDLTVGLADSYLKGLLFLLAVALWAVQSWYWSRLLVDREYGDHTQYSGFQRFLIRHIPRLLGVLAFAFAIKALWHAADDGGVGLAYVIIASGLAIAFYALTQYRRKLQKRISSLVNSSFEVFEDWLYKIIMGVSIAVILVFSIWAYSSPVSMGFTLGAGTVFFIAMASIVPVGSMMVAITHTYKFPLISSLLLIAIAFSSFNDNHAIRSIEQPAQQITAEKAFDRWLLQGNINEKRQIVVVATAGGGIRAAYWTSSVLGALQDRETGFRDKLFAISGVSGGSVGATVFTSLLNQDVKALCQGTPSTCYQEKGESILSRDFLGPTITAMLYPDLMQRFLPIAILPDRARALERSWEVSWKLSTSESNNALSNGLTQLYGPEQTGNRWLPLLFLNATHEESGSRIITSPMRIEQTTFADSIDFYQTHPCDVHASTAAHSSARFTYVSPAGRISQGECSAGESDSPLRDTHLVDGGYFENYGAATAADLLGWLATEAEQRNIQIQPIVIQISNDVNIPENILDDNYLPDANPTRFMNETLAPLNTLLNTRSARGEMEFINLYRWTRDLKKTHDSCFFHFRFYPDEGNEPALGWVLSEKSQKWIQDHLLHQNREMFESLLRTLSSKQCSSPIN